MATWGTGAPWGTCNPWGTAGCEDTICEEASQRVLMQIKTPAQTQHNFHDLVCVMVEPLGHIRSVLQQMVAAFDLSSAVGDQLDKLGSVMGLPRQGYTDTRYRTFLEIQRDLLLSVQREGANWTGTANNILTIARTFVGPGPSIQFQNTPPYAYTLSLPTLPVDEVLLLATFICRATYGGVLGYVYFGVGAGGVYGSEHGAVVGEGIYGSVHGAVPGAATYGYVVTIGADPC